jgi:hypothetical protein
MSTNNHNNNNNPPSPNKPKKRHRWWYKKRTPVDEGNHNKHQKINTDAGPPHSLQMSSQDKLKKYESERRENEKQVANMEKQLHEYFHKTNTSYTYVDDTGIYKFSSAPAPAPAPTPAPASVPAPTAPAPAPAPAPWTAHAPGTMPNPFMNITFNPFPSVGATTLFSAPFQWPSPYNTIGQTNAVPLAASAAAAAAAAASDPPPPEQEITDIVIKEEINHIDDLIALCTKYPLSANVRYNINMKAIHAIREPLMDLKNMIGMETIKRTIVDQILYYLQELHKPVNKKEADTSYTSTAASTQASTAPPLLFNPFAEPFVSSQQYGTSATFDFKTLNNRFMDMNKKKSNNDTSELFSDFSAPTKGDFMHTVIYGPPGSGKTEVAKIIGRIFSNLGILTRKSFKKVSRNDLVAGYLGQTAIKTKDIIKASMGGVLFIDEAYSLGNSEKKDSFAKECVDTLCEALSEYKHNWMVIIAGYEKELNDCFFSLNDGLNSRFTWRFKLDNYKPIELKSIYEKQVRDFGWTISSATDKHGNGLREEWFSEHMDYFTTYGRDMETLFTKTKIAHSRRVFCLPDSAKTEITMTDLENGFKLFIENPEVKDRKERGSCGGSYMKTLYL